MPLCPTHSHSHPARPAPPPRPWRSMALTGIYQLSRKINADYFQKGDNTSLEEKAE